LKPLAKRPENVFIHLLFFNFSPLFSPYSDIQKLIFHSRLCRALFVLQ
jgi:hypothetical protein